MFPARGANIWSVQINLEYPCSQCGQSMLQDTIKFTRIPKVLAKRMPKYCNACYTWPQLLPEVCVSAVLSPVPTANMTWGMCSKQCNSTTYHSAGPPLCSKRCMLTGLKMMTGEVSDRMMSSSQINRNLHH